MGREIALFGKDVQFISVDFVERETERVRGLIVSKKGGWWNELNSLYNEKQVKLEAFLICYKRQVLF